MAVPFRRTSKTRKRTRRAHHALKNISSNVCLECGNPVLPHRACAKCGVYNKEKVVEFVETSEVENA